MEKFFSCEEIAVRYAVKITTVWEWIRRGDLPAIKIGKRENRTGLIEFHDE